MNIAIWLLLITVGSVSSPLIIDRPAEPLILYETRDTSPVSTETAAGDEICIEPYFKEIEAENDESWQNEDLYIPEWVYMGDWIITAYCSCEICCGEFASGYTASGEPAIAGYTAASNILPFGTEVMIDGNIYVIQDTGWSPYGDEWIDLYFDDHEEALAFGLQVKEVFVKC